MSLILLNKPCGVISQFSEHEKHSSLSEFITDKNFYPAGRLDHDSEGLLILTDEGKIQHCLSHPKHKQPKTYWVQVEGEMTDAALSQLESGVILKDGKTLPAKAKKINEPDIWPRDPPVRYRAEIPTSWCELTITEGKNRQVRRMTAAVGFPTLRLIRYSIGEFTINGLSPGEWSKISTPPQLEKQANAIKLLGTTRHRRSNHSTRRKIPAGGGKRQR
ncbi:MAG: pseudouridine synthase [Gammaproteobacteria bacterium]|nr:pseudouridine synthase [Gammaproteobacteria bacterium]MCW8986242.1 pseudouridine synthase [Gammaproteobacteria bacterium]